MSKTAINPDGSLAYTGESKARWCLRVYGDQYWFDDFYEALEAEEQELRHTPWEHVQLVDTQKWESRDR